MGTEQDAINFKKNPVTKAEREHFGLPAGAMSSRDLQSIVDYRLKRLLELGYWGDKPTKISKPRTTGGVGGVGGMGGKSGSAGSTAGAGTTAGSRIGDLLARYLAASLGNVSADTAAQQGRINDLQTGLKTRYDDYLAKLQAAQTAAQNNINTATTNLLGSIPQSATANPVFFQQPTATSNVYAEYMKSLGYSSPEIAAMQNYTDTQAGAMNEMARQSAEAQRIAQQNYLDNLRSTAQMAGTAANQRLAMQVPSMQMSALAAYNQGLNTLGQSRQGVQSGAAQSRQSTLDALLPILLQYPSAANSALGAFGYGRPKKPKVAGTVKGKKKAGATVPVSSSNVAAF